MSKAAKLRKGPNSLVLKVDGFAVVALFGAPVMEDAELLVDELAQQVASSSAVSAMVDMRSLRALDSGPFLRVSDYVFKHRDGIASLVGKVAIVSKGGMATASIAGALTMALGREFPIEAFHAPDDALLWLQAPEGVRQHYAGACATFASTGTFVQRCREYIAEDLLDASIERCATVLGLAAAELTRHLRQAGTSFREELREARIAEAKELLLTTDDLIADIAEDVGYRKKQNFSDAFKRATGQSPAAWRKRHRS